MYLSSFLRSEVLMAVSILLTVTWDRHCVLWYRQMPKFWRNQLHTPSLALHSLIGTAVRENVRTRSNCSETLVALYHTDDSNLHIINQSHTLLRYESEHYEPSSASSWDSDSVYDSPPFQTANLRRVLSVSMLPTCLSQQWTAPYKRYQTSILHRVYLLNKFPVLKETENIIRLTKPANMSPIKVNNVIIIHVQQKKMNLRNLSKYLSNSKNMTSSETGRDITREGNMQIICTMLFGTYELLLRSMTV